MSFVGKIYEFVESFSSIIALLKYFHFVAMFIQTRKSSRALGHSIKMPNIAIVRFLDIKITEFNGFCSELNPV